MIEDDDTIAVVIFCHPGGDSRLKWIRPTPSLSKASVVAPPSRLSMIYKAKQRRAALASPTHTYNMGSQVSKNAPADETSDAFVDEKPTFSRRNAMQSTAQRLTASSQSTTPSLTPSKLSQWQAEFDEVR